MNLQKLAKHFVSKYASEIDRLEKNIRKGLDVLYAYPHKTFEILEYCANAGASKPDNKYENMAAAGHKFCKNILALIDYLYENKDTINVGEIRDILITLINLIQNNRNVSFTEKGNISKKDNENELQFQHVSLLIHEMLPVRKRSDIEARKKLQAQSRKGLSRILSYSKSLLEMLEELEVMSPEKFTHISDVDIDADLPPRFIPQRAELSSYDAVDFIRQYGDEYGLYTKDEWELIIRDDPQLKNDLTTVINALNRGRISDNDTIIKAEIKRLLQEHFDRNKNNFKDGNE